VRSEPETLFNNKGLLGRAKKDQGVIPSSGGGFGVYQKSIEKTVHKKKQIKYEKEIKRKRANNFALIRGGLWGSNGRSSGKKTDGRIVKKISQRTTGGVNAKLTE